MALTDQDTMKLAIDHGAGTCDDDLSFPTDFASTKNPRNAWIHYEYRMQSDASVGVREIRIDNLTGAKYKTNCPNWMNNTRSFSIGGYFRGVYEPWLIDGCTCATSCWGETKQLVAYISDLNNNAFRYFDDMYVDTTWSRVMLCNTSTYPDGTDDSYICEPQIPVTWADGSIEVTVNQGALTTGPAFLYVFDSNNVANGTGYSVTLGEGGPSAVGCTISGGTLR
jgi:hypothetical protein